MQTRTMVWESDSACSTNVLGIRVLGGGRGLSFGHGNTTEKRALWEGNGRQSSGDCIAGHSGGMEEMRKDPSLLGRGGGVS